jgi:hypothetical protein
MAMAKKKHILSEPHLPEPFTGAKVTEAIGLDRIPSSDHLARFLNQRGIDTDEWGKGNTKAVSKFWGELKGDEAGLEVWKKRTGEVCTIRVTHVLRAKVTSPEYYERGIFLFNTWQQYGDGRSRTRNGLLSEKLTISEMPLTNHLHEVCSRAVIEEEMARLVESTTRIGPDSPAPAYDSSYVCPLTVVSEDFVDHTVEIEASKSYPGLTTVYHLYTVDIICSGLPSVDFNTLEFEHDDENHGKKRPLKYIHAWVWLQWCTIQRYLFEGSELKERKSKGSFTSPQELEDWLSHFSINLHEWGSNGWKPVAQLFSEVEKEETQLEHWGRNDGVPLLMRVVHVIQLKVTSSDPSLSGKYLFHVWHQMPDGLYKAVNRPMARKMSIGLLPFDEARFTKAAAQAVQEQLSHLVDINFQLLPGHTPGLAEEHKANVKILSLNFSDHRCDLEDSPSFKDIVTMYHLYTVDVHCEGIPSTDFASVVMQGGKPHAFGWRWVSWPQTTDILHTRAQMLERREAKERRELEEQTKALSKAVDLLRIAREGGAGSKAEENRAFQEMSRLTEQLTAHVKNLGVTGPGDSTIITPRTSMIPPAMVSDLANRKLVSDKWLDEVKMAGARDSHPSGEAHSPSSSGWPNFLFCGCAKC